MSRGLDTAYGLGRLAFGLALIAAPAQVGSALVGGDARQPMVRATFRFYGTRDVVLGLGTLRAALADGDVDAWLGAGIASDVLDTAVMFGEWDTLPPDKRVRGVLMALGAGAWGAALMARR